MEQFEQIRRDHAREGLSIRALAKRHGVHRRAVRQALASPVPPPKRRPEHRPAPKLGPFRVLIDEWLTADLQAPRKQRHTARRVWQRLVDEHGADVSERQVDRYVAARRRMMGEVEAFVPLVSDAGVEAEVDWGQAQVILRGERVEVHVFLMRACHSGASFVAAFQAETQQAFLEGHVAAFEWSMTELNRLLEDACWANLERTIIGRPEPISEMLTRERLLLSELPREAHCTAEEATPRVDSKAMVTVRQNRYSVPAALAGLRVRAQIAAGEITVWHDGQLVASHERLPGRHGTSAQLDHYLDLLKRKPGALARSLALRQERDRGDWPACFDELWSAIAERVGREEAARQMVDVLLLHRELSASKVELAVRGALAAGAHDGRAVSLLARRGERTVAPTLEVEERLAGIGSPPPTDISGYDQLRQVG